MNIYVCIKQVPDTEAKIKLSSDASSVDTQGLKFVVNPYDEFAIEEALKIKAAKPETLVTAISVGPKARVSDALRTALAMGADEATVIDAPENLDSFQTAKALAEVLKGEKSDLIFSGKSAIDDNAMAVSQMLAEFLNVPHATVVMKFELKDGQALLQREVEGGTHENIEIKLPAVIAATKGLNSPRYASLPGIMKAKKKTIKEVAYSSLSVGEAKTSYKNFQLPPDRPSCKMLAGDAGVQAKELVRLLREESKSV